MTARGGVFGDLRAERDALTDAARLDARTGLANADSFDAEIERIHASVAAERSTYGLLLADLDHFHEFNRVHGMLTGNDALRAVADAIAAAWPTVEVYRYGGEEFAIVVRDLPDRRVLDAIGTRIVDAVRGLGQPHLGRPSGPALLTVTVAGTVVDPTASSVDDAITRVDEALVSGKADGRDRYVAARRG